MGERELPEGWEWVRVEDITSKIESTNPENYPDKEFFYLDIDSVDNSQQKITNPKKILGSEAPSRARQIVKSGDILFSTVRTYLKNIAFVEEQYDNQIASTGFCVIRPKKEVDNKFIFHYVQTQDFLKRLELLQRGANYPAVRESDVLSQQIPLPPLPIQHDIVAVLEQVEAVKRQRKEADALTGVLLQSVFYKMFGDPVKNEMEWEIGNIEKISEYVSYGFTNPMSTTNEGPYLVTATNIRDRKVDYTSSRHTSQNEYNQLTAKSKPKIGDILITKDGTLGNVAIVDKDDICINQSVACIRPLKDKIDTLFFAFLLQTPQIQYEIIKGSGGSSIKHIYITKLARVEIPLPPLALQQQFTCIAESLERLRQQQVASSKEIDGLCEGLMQRAFAGDVAH